MAILVRRYPCVALWVTLLLVAGIQEEVSGDSSGMEDLGLSRPREERHGKLPLELEGGVLGGKKAVAETVESILQPSAAMKKTAEAGKDTDQEMVGESMEAGMEVCDKTWCRPKKSFEAVYTPDNNRRYTAVGVLHKPVPNFEMTFEVKAKNDAHIAFSNDAGFPTGTKKTQEIVIGGWRNTKCVLRGRRAGTNRGAVNTRALDANSFERFWIKKIGNTIMVGKHGDKKPFMRHAFYSSEIVPDVKYVGVMTGWGSTGEWKQIDVKPVEYVPQKVLFLGKVMKRVQVSGPMTDASVVKACQQNGLYPVCGSTNTFDGQCEVVKGNLRSQADAKGLYLYYSKANGGRPIMTLKSGRHKANSHDQNGETLCTARRKQSDADFRYMHYKMYRTKVNGDMTRENIVRACKARGMKPVCDHQRYRQKGKKQRGEAEQQACKNVGNQFHFSHTYHNKRHGIDVRSVQWAFFYAGKKSLLNTGRGHRWSRAGDKDGDTFCVKSDKDFLKKHGNFNYGGRKIQRLAVQGQMNSKNIYAACQKNGMRPVCDHPNHYDGLCEVLHKPKDKWHFSKSSDTKRQKLPSISLEGAYMYAGFFVRHGRYSRKHLRNRSRWSNGHDSDGHTLCTKPAEEPDEFEWKDWLFVRVQVKEKINSASMYKACEERGMKPACDQFHYSDGKCRAPGINRWHLSHPTHDKRHKIPVDKVKGVFFYTGKSRGGKRALVNTGRRHYWSPQWANHADTLCVQRTEAYRKKHKGDWGYLVPGMVVALQGGRHGRYCGDDGSNVRCNRNEPNLKEQFTIHKVGNQQGVFALKGGRKGKYCADEGAKWRCDRDKIGQWERFQELKTGEGQVALIGGRNGKLCADESNQIRCNRNGIGQWEKFTIECIRNCASMQNEGDEKKYGVFKFRGRTIERTDVKGVMNSKDIFNACQAKGMKPLCDKASYFDGRCEVVGGNWHFSHPHHARSYAKQVAKQSLRNAFVYTGYAKGGRSLKHLKNKHRWSTDGDKDSKTLCVKPEPSASRKFNWDGFELHRVQVKGTINSQSILKACQAKAMTPLCDHENYQDGKCKQFGPWHFSHPNSAKRHQVPVEKMKWAFFYCGTGNGNRALFNTGNGHKWSTGREADGDTFCVKRSADFLKKHGVFDYYGRKLTRVPVKGQMKSQEIWKACQAKGMRPVCDHANYFDGRCEVVNMNHNYGRWHMSHPSHTKAHGGGKIPAVSVRRAFFYCGFARGKHQFSLKHKRSSHRWSNNKDRNMDTICVAHKDRKKDSFKYKHYNMIRVAVKGEMNAANLLKACNAKGMKPICDHSNYADGKCLNLRNKWHWSHGLHHVKRYARKVDIKKLEWAFFYTGRHHTGALLNTGHSHRWKKNGYGFDRDGDTFCGEIDSQRFEAYKKKFWSFNVNGHIIKRVKVIGAMVSDQIWKACQSKGMRPVCDHANYFDGRCVIVGLNHNYGRWHMSHPHHTRHWAKHDNKKVDPESLIGAFLYVGRRNHGWSYQHKQNGHRRSNKNDRDGETLCTKAPDISKDTFTFRGHKMTRVHVKGIMNGKNIFKACEEKGMKPVCDHQSYSDGQCQSFGNWHWSSGNRHNLKGVDVKMLRWAFFYAGTKKALMMRHHGHRWSQTGNRGDRDGDTFCVKADEAWLKKFGVFKYKGKIINRIQVDGPMTSPNIFKTCLKNKLRPLCNHRSYADGMCEVIGNNNWHFSHPSHTKRHAREINQESLRGAFTYCGHARGQFSLLNKANSHRWATNKDKDGQTLCTPAAKKQMKFEWRGYEFMRVLVKDTINSENIVKACSALKMKPVCDRGRGGRYADGKCHSFNNDWHFSHPSHAKSRGLSGDKLRNVFFYAGTQKSYKSNGKTRHLARVNTGHNSKWSRGWEYHAETMCVTRSKDFLKKHGKFKFNSFTIQRVVVPGRMNSENIWKACQSRSLRPVCNHGRYYDGRCVVVNDHHNRGHWYLSQRGDTSRWGKDIPLKSIRGAFLYSGFGNRGEALQHTFERGHRWSNKNDVDAQTLCTKPLQRSALDFHFRGYKFVRTAVSGDMNSKNINQACKDKHLKPVCDHQNYKDANCKSFGPWHFSHPNHLRHHLGSNDIASKIQYSFFYANGGRSFVNKGHGHRAYRSGKDKDGDTYCVSDKVDAAFMKQHSTAKYNGQTIQKVQVSGVMNSKNIHKACVAKGMVPVCDHKSYQDGMCRALGGNWHFSSAHNTRKGRPLDPKKTGMSSHTFRGVFFYCGRANRERSLLHRHRNHRWSNNKDHDGLTMCTKPRDPKTLKFEWRGYDFEHVLVKDKINRHSILKACKDKSMIPLCDHQSYNDGNCKRIGHMNWHWSSIHHVASKAKVAQKYVQNVFFYTNSNRARVNTGRGHGQWSQGWENYASTMCVKRSASYHEKYGKFTIDGHAIQRVQVKGKMVSKNIWKACKAKGLRPVCNHGTYFDGRCVVVNAKHAQGHWHMSYPHHTRQYLKGTSPDALLGVYTYCGVANHKRSLQMTYTGSHRWSNDKDLNGETLCTKAPDRKKDSFRYHHHKMERVKVKGWMTQGSIARACKAKAMEAVCEYRHHKDSGCKPVGAVHWSLPHQVRRLSSATEKKASYAYFYNGRGRPYLNNGRGRRVVQNGRDRDGDTFCTDGGKGFLKKFGIFKHNGVAIRRIQVDGAMNSKNIFNACIKRNMKPVCNEAKRGDGMCVVVGNQKGGWQWSHKDHTRRHTNAKEVKRENLENGFWYMGTSNGQRSLLHGKSGHRWSNNNDRDETSFCTKPPKMQPKFDWKGYEFHRVEVKERVSGLSIRRACGAKGMKPVCDHYNYRDSHCQSFGNRWHFSHASHIKSHAKSDNNKWKNAFYYTGNRKPLVNDGRSHYWARGWENHFDTMCVRRAPDFLKKFGKFKYDGAIVERVAVKGRINQGSIWNACRGKRMRPVCDHSNYFDGRCVVLGDKHRHGRWHWSRKSGSNLAGVNRHSLAGAYMYTGGVNTGALEHRFDGGHRWTNNNDHGDTLCTPAPSRSAKSFTFRTFKFYRVKVSGKITSDKIRRACRDNGGMQPVCDHQNYNDGNCKSFGPWHFSHPSHVKRFAGVDNNKLKWAFFYTGRHHTGALLNNGHSHRWVHRGRRQDKDGDTFCVKADEDYLKQHGLFTFKGATIQRVKVTGQMKSQNLLNACVKHGMVPVCNSIRYADGVCEVVGGGTFSFSKATDTNKHKIPKKSVDGAFIYSGRASGDRSLLHRLQNHRWSNDKDKDQTTLCTKKSKASYREFDWRGYEFHRVLVKGQIDQSSIRKACKDKGLKPVCDHYNYRDSHCQTFGNHWHFSQPSDIKRRAKSDNNKWKNAFYYTGNRKPLVNDGRSHYWARGWEKHADTMCVRKSPDFLKKFGKFTYEGRQVQRVDVSGIMNSQNIFKACLKHGMRPVCDKTSYRDGMCEVIAKSWMFHHGHFSHSSHTTNHAKGIQRESLQGAFFYCGRGHGDRSLKHRFNGGHRWSNNNDRDQQTLCTKASNTNGDKITWHGHRLERVQVNTAINGNSILKACKARGMKPVCNRRHYRTKDCEYLHNHHWYFSYPNHVKRHMTAAQAKWMENLAVYSGKARALVNTGRTHYWTRGWENHIDTLCVKKSRPVKVVAGMIVAFRGGRNNRWCANDGNTWKCNRNHHQKWEKFELEGVGVGIYALKSLRNNRYCWPRHDRISCSQHKIQRKDMFRIHQAGGGKVALRSVQSNRFCYDYGNTVRCNQGAALTGHKEVRFEMKCLGNCNGGAAVKLVVNSIVAFRGGRHNAYCRNIHHTWRCTSGGIGRWEKFKVVAAGGNRIGLKSIGSNRFCADEGHRIRCNRGHLHGWEKFSYGRASSGLIWLRGGRQNQYCYDHGNTVRCNRKTFNNDRHMQFKVRCVDNCNGAPDSPPVSVKNGMIVGFKGGASNRWCAQEHRWRCNRGHLRQWEKYQVVGVGGGKYAFKSLRNNRYCRTEHHRHHWHTGRIVCSNNHNHIDNRYDLFRIHQAGGGKVALRSVRNNKFCHDDGNTVRCNRNGYGHAREKFEMKCVGNCNGVARKQVKLKANSIVAIQNQRQNRWCGGHTWHCNSHHHGTWQKFRVMPAGGNRIALKSMGSHRFCADEGHRILCNRGGIGQWEKFSYGGADSSGRIWLRGGRGNQFCESVGRKVTCDRHRPRHRRRSASGRRFYVKVLGHYKAAQNYRPKHGSIVAFRGGRHNRWCASEHSTWRCNRGHHHRWEQFRVYHSGHKFALRSLRNNRFCADEKNRINCNRGHVRGWERFSAKKLSDGKIALQGGRNGWCYDKGHTVECRHGYSTRHRQKFEMKCLKHC